MNKKATDKIISVYWFAVLFLVAAAVVYMVAIFYGEPFDIRKIEADILVNQVVDCIAEGGYLNSQIYKEGNFSINNENFLEICNLNFELEDFGDWQGQGQYYVELNITNLASNNIFLGPIKVGNFHLKDNCGGSKNFPQCRDRSFYSLSKEGDKQIKYQINILASVRKTEKNMG